MKKIFTLVFLVILYLNNLSYCQAQCTPDTNCVPVGNAGNICPASLDTGIVSVLYSKIITLIPPDTSIVYQSTSYHVCELKLNSITGLPPGLTYTANPASGAFMVTTPYTRYCTLISGTPTTAGSYKLYISITPYVTLPILGCTNSGQTLIDSSVTMTITSPARIGNLTTNKSNYLSCSQNPYSISTKIIYNSNCTELVELKIHDMLGNIVYIEKMYAHTGQNMFNFKGTELHSGMYMYSVSNNKTTLVKKLIKTN